MEHSWVTSATQPPAPLPSAPDDRCVPPLCNTHRGMKQFILANSKRERMTVMKQFLFGSRITAAMNKKSGETLRQLYSYICGWDPWTNRLKKTQKNCTGQKLCLHFQFCSLFKPNAHLMPWGKGQRWAGQDAVLTGGKVGRQGQAAHTLPVHGDHLVPHRSEHAASLFHIF